jgi:hypothetical protein
VYPGRKGFQAKAIRDPRRFEVRERIDVFQIPDSTAPARRWPQFPVRALTLAGFVFTIAAGLFGCGRKPQLRHHLRLIAWWTALKLVFIPWRALVVQRMSHPLPGEWLQQRY